MTPTEIEQAITEFVQKWLKDHNNLDLDPDTSFNQAGLTRGDCEQLCDDTEGEATGLAGRTVVLPGPWRDDHFNKPMGNFIADAADLAGA